MNNVVEVVRERQIGRKLGAGNHGDGDPLVMDQLRMLCRELVVVGNEDGPKLKSSKLSKEFGVL